MFKDEQMKEVKKLIYIRGKIQSLEWVASAKSLSQVDRNRIVWRIDRLKKCLKDLSLAENDPLIDFEQMEEHE